jgi:ATP/maltotriose-dependent transcriptional regulator MalT
MEEIPSGVAPSSATMTLRLKAAAPPAAWWVVSRPGLEELLDGGLEGSLTTVVAGPGFGKTTLLAAWAANRPRLRWYGWTGKTGTPRLLLEGRWRLSRSSLP